MLLHNFLDEIKQLPHSGKCGHEWWISQESDHLGYYKTDVSIAAK